MALTINNNMMSANTARNLNAHYSRLNLSTQRLSSGLRINSAADDAAGLAIRELQRADIASLRQGARNANDAVSLIQTADGALQIIDEKLIRMKELTEQAATGTYDSTQRLMIESEFQAMASEITRIAAATDFNGIHLLNGNLSGDHVGSNLRQTGALKIHFGTSNDSAEDYYYIAIGECTAQAFGIGNASTFESAFGKIVQTFEKNLTREASTIDNPNVTPAQIAAEVKKMTENFSSVLGKLSMPQDDTELNYIRNLWNPANATDPKFAEAGKQTDYALPSFPASMAEYNTLSSADQQKWQYAWGKAALYNYGNSPSDSLRHEMGNGAFLGSPNTVDATVNDDLNKARENAMKSTHTDSAQYTYAGFSIDTQENAQMTLDAVNDAIVKKDKIRSNLGALQNRLENTITNLNIQAENLQAAESRISDVDVATEMTQFVRNQILTQSAVAMLAQANSLPKMAMQLIGG